MSNAIKTNFSIKDLENFTGIKSHTIRIWEKRYGLLEPARTDTNIRYYDSDNFIKLLNINLLYNNGYKISKIAKLSEKDLFDTAKKLTSSEAIKQSSMNAFQLAMLNFDVNLFNDTYMQLSGFKTFREIFIEVFIPFLGHIGNLWQTKSLKPVHEHFISNLIIQKLQASIERNQSINNAKSEYTYVLYLPENEIHELGLMYLNYELTLRGLHTIYLGQNISRDNVADITGFFEKIHFISYFTVEPTNDDINDYIKSVHSDLIDETDNKFWFLGRKALKFKEDEVMLPENIKAFSSIEEILNTL